jgi:hypothetical protein
MPMPYKDHILIRPDPTSHDVKTASGNLPVSASLVSFITLPARMMKRLRPQHEVVVVRHGFAVITLARGPPEPVTYLAVTHIEGSACPTRLPMAASIRPVGSGQQANRPNCKRCEAKQIWTSSVRVGDEIRISDDLRQGDRHAARRLQRGM